MKITMIKINNFRLLKNFTLDIEEDLSLIIGKNNTGKTSILTVLDKFLNSSEKNRITIDDFNVDLKKQLIDIISGEQALGSKDEYYPLGIDLKIYIRYDESDDLSTVSSLIMSLDPDDNNIILSFEYKINYQNLVDIIDAYQANKDKYDEDAVLFLKENLSEFFGPIQRKSLLYKNESIFSDLIKENISLQNVLAFNFISAKRNVTNKDNDKTLSTQTSRIYKKSSETTEQEEAVAKFKQQLREADDELTDIYDDMFSSLLKKVTKFGGVKQCETDIKITSTLQHRELLEGNTTVLYSHDTHDLPEHYNGLGYMNLISMIFEIEMLLTEFRRSATEKAAAINLFFIEEPEAHTHPQMQYVFIKNIKSLLKESRKRDDGIEIHLQTAITTHSSHIVSESDFDDIKYLKKSLSSNSVISKNLKSLKDEYSSDDEKEDVRYKKHFKFLRQYLTLNRSELFFADKAILIEGDTERVLLPAIMKKIDQDAQNKEDTPLLSQNISIVEVGAHSQTFEKFINFIGIKSLIITDIDSYYEEVEFEDDGVTHATYKNGNPKTKAITCNPSNTKAQKTSNNSLLFFHNKNRDDLDYFIDLPIAAKALAKKDDSWEQDEHGSLFLAYQAEENGYHGRSFEDAFFSLNKSLLGNEADDFPSLTKKWFDEYVNNDSGDPLEFAEKAVGSKPSLAIEILLNSITKDGKEFVNWQVPKYIKEGLEWLRKN